MARKSYIQINGKLYDKDLPLPGEGVGLLRPVVAPDLPDFVSPIDGKHYSGRAGLREHNARHNVVLAADLAGLPPKTLHQDHTPSRQQREETRRTIAEILNSRTY